MSSEIITKNDLKAILDQVLLPPQTVQTVTPTFTTDVTSPVGTVVSATAKIIGKTCLLTIAVQNTSAVAAGSNVFHGRISSEVRPAQLSNGVGYYGSSIGTLQLGYDGDLTIRIGAAQLAANSTIYVSACYILP